MLVFSGGGREFQGSIFTWLLPTMRRDVIDLASKYGQFALADTFRFPGRMLAT